MAELLLELFSEEIPARMQTRAHSARLAYYAAASKMLAGKPFNINSPQQLGKVLFNKIEKLPLLKHRPLPK